MVDRHLLRLQNFNGLVKLRGINVKSEVIGTGKLLGRIGMWRAKIGFTKQIQNRAIGQPKIRDFACGDEVFERSGDFGSGEFVESENLAIELARSGHVLDVQGDVVDGAEGADGEGALRHGNRGVDYFYSIG
jgi:hypothetical protein